MKMIREYMTPARLRYMRELHRMVVGEPYVRGPTRHFLLRLGWIQGVYEMPDGERVTAEKFDEIRPVGYPCRWDGVGVYGVTLTDRGRARLDEAERAG